MKRWFALTCLTVALVASAAGCLGKKGLRSSKKAAVVHPIAAAQAPSAPEAVAPAPAPVAIPVPALGAGGASGSGMAVVILMLPGTDAARTAGATGAARTYKLSLSTNADTATIQIDGQPAVTAPVQRVYPAAASAPRVSAVALPRAPVVAPPRSVVAPVRSRYAAQLPAAPGDMSPETMELGEARARQLRRTAISTAMRPPLPPPAIINPNGAPIID